MKESALMTKKGVLAIISESCPKAAKDRLSDFFVTVALPPDPMLAPPVASHPDMLITIIDKTLFCHKEYYMAASEKMNQIIAMSKLRLVCTEGIRGAKYPLDVGLNAFILQDQQKLIARKASLAAELIPYLAADTRQGYAGCSSLYINGTIVTADPSICRAADQCNIPVHRIPAGGILLPGYDTGLIGGCGGIWDRTIYLFGNAASCAQGRALKAFCQKNSISEICLCNGPLSDFGGIQFVKIAPF